MIIYTENAAKETVKVFILFENNNVFVGWVEVTKPRTNYLHHIIAGFRASTQPTLNTFTISEVSLPTSHD